MKTKKSIVGIILIIIGAIVLLYAMRAKDTDAPADTSQQNVAGEEVRQGEAQKPAAGKPATGSSGASRPTRNEAGQWVVAYTDKGFSPYLVEVKQGEEVVFKNRSNHGVWVTANMHPTATTQSYSAFDSGRTLGPGEEWTFAFLRPGTWGYKNLNDTDHLGVMVVQPQ